MFFKETDYNTTIYGIMYPYLKMSTSYIFGFVHRFREYDCPPHAELPEYIQLGTIELSPEIMIM